MTLHIFYFQVLSINYLEVLFMFEDDEMLDLEDSVLPTFSLLDILDILDFYDPMEDD